MTTDSAAPPTPELDYPDDDEADLRRQRSTRTLVFILTWIAYATYYFGRAGFPVVKSTLEKKHGLSLDMLGWIDTGYLTAYAVGQFASGFIGDRIGPRRLVGVGMFGTAAACMMFGLSSLGLVLLASYIINGLFQSTGWPGTCKAMGSWLTPRERGTAMGIWSTCYQIGPIAATWVATYLFWRFGWRWSFLGPAMLIGFVGLLILLLLPERRTDAAPRPTSGNGGGSVGGSPKLPDSDFRLLNSPVIWSLGTAYFCLKLIRYSIFLWLPYYLHKVLHYPEDVAGYRSISFTVGGVLGSVVVGYASDRYFPGRRRLISAVMCAALAVALLLYIRVAPLSMTINFLSMVLIGFCLFGPDSIIAGAAAQDIGGKHNVAKAAGFINGVGSVGAIFQGIVTTKISRSRFEWDGVFYLFVALSLVSSVALLIGKPPRTESSS